MGTKKRGKPGVMLYHTMTPAVDLMTNEAAGQLFKIIMHYSEDGEEPENLPPDIAMVWAFVRRDIDTDSEHYADIVEQATRAANKGWGKGKPEITEPDTDAYGRIRTDANTNTNTTGEVFQKIPLRKYGNLFPASALFCPIQRLKK